MASLTVRGTVFGVDISVPLLEIPGLGAGLPASALEQMKQPSPAVPALSAAPAPSAEVAELQRRLATSRNPDVAALMANNPDQLDPLDVASIARWLQAKGRNMDIAEEQIHVHAHWRQAFMPAGHIPEVDSYGHQSGCTAGNCWCIQSLDIISLAAAHIVCSLRLLMLACHSVIDLFYTVLSLCMLQDQIVNEIASNKVYLQGNDVQGRTVFIVLAKQQEMGRAEETKRFICYTLDNAIAAADPARNHLRQFVCLFDLAGLQQSCLHLHASIVFLPNTAQSSS